MFPVLHASRVGEDVEAFTVGEVVSYPSCKQLPEGGILGHRERVDNGRSLLLFLAFPLLLLLYSSQTMRPWPNSTATTYTSQCSHGGKREGDLVEPLPPLIKQGTKGVFRRRVFDKESAWPRMDRDLKVVEETRRIGFSF